MKTRVIDLTDEESAKNDSAATQVQNLAKIPVDTNMLQKILETLEKQGSVSACSNLLSFQKPEKSQISVHGSWFQMEMKIQQGSLKQQPSLGSANVRNVFGQQSNRPFLSFLWRRF